jgi:hypothetical protein
VSSYTLGSRSSRTFLHSLISCLLGSDEARTVHRLTASSDTGHCIYSRTDVHRPVEYRHVRSRARTCGRDARPKVLASPALGPWVRIPLKAWVYVRVFLSCVVLCRQRPCDGLITGPRIATKCFCVVLPSVGRGLATSRSPVQGLLPNVCVLCCPL